MARLVFLGRLEDLAGAAEIAVPLARSASLSVVLDSLPSELVAGLRSSKVRVAVNGALVSAEHSFDALTVADGDEIAFLPPVSGG